MRSPQLVGPMRHSEKANVLQSECQKNFANTSRRSPVNHTKKLLEITGLKLYGGVLSIYKDLFSRHCRHLHPAPNQVNNFYRLTEPACLQISLNNQKRSTALNRLLFSWLARESYILE